MHTMNMMNPRAPIEMNDAAWEDSPFGCKCRHRMGAAEAVNTSLLEEDVREDSHASRRQSWFRKFKGGRASQDVRIQGYLDNISIPANAALMAAELDSATQDCQRAQGLMEESAVRSYDWDTKVVLEKLLDLNEKSSHGQVR